MRQTFSKLNQLYLLYTRKIAADVLREHIQLATLTLVERYRFRLRRRQGPEENLYLIFFRPCNTTSTLLYLYWPHNGESQNVR